jgi:serine/threonine protein phosphatase PrpC
LKEYQQYMKDLEEEKETKVTSESIIPLLTAWLCNATVKFDPKNNDKTRTNYRRDSMLEKPNLIEDSFEGIELETLTEDEAIQILLRESFFEMSELVQTQKLQDGATAAVVYIKGSKCFVANAGDSRVVLSRDTTAQRLSVDHKPDDDSEKRRIREVGGFIADGRVNGIMGVSRAIGDNFLEPMIIHDPFTRVIELNETDSFIIIACDGVWDVTSDQEAVDLILDEKDPRVASAKLRNYAYENKSTDNITCTVVSLNSIL